MSVRVPCTMRAFAPQWSTKCHARRACSCANPKLLNVDVKRANAHYRALFKLAPVAYLVTDERAVIRHANRAASKLLQVVPNRLRGKPLACLFTTARDADSVIVWPISHRRQPSSDCVSGCALAKERRAAWPRPLGSFATQTAVLARSAGCWWTIGPHSPGAPLANPERGARRPRRGAHDSARAGRRDEPGAGARRRIGAARGGAGQSREVGAHRDRQSRAQDAVNCDRWARGAAAARRTRRPRRGAAYGHPPHPGSTVVHPAPGRRSGRI